MTLVDIKYTIFNIINNLIKFQKHEITVSKLCYCSSKIKQQKKTDVVYMPKKVHFDELP